MRNRLLLAQGGVFVSKVRLTCAIITAHIFTMPKNKKILLSLLFLFVLSCGAMYLVSSADAATGLQYTLLEKIPGTEKVGSDLKGYIEAIYKIALIIIVLSAVLMLSIGGFMYMTSAGNTSAMGTAKAVIFDSIIGLVIALTAYLLLYVINPDLVNITINGLSPVSVPGVPPVAPPPPGKPWPDDSKERAALGSSFSFNKANCKTEGQTEGCTSMAGSAAIPGLQAFQEACNCSIEITGGTECWQHGSCGPNNHHTINDYAVDMAHGAVDTYIKNNGGTPLCQLNGRNVYKIGSSVFFDEDSAHWHVNFNKSSCSSI